MDTTTELTSMIDTLVEFAGPMRLTDDALERLAQIRAAHVAGEDVELSERMAIGVAYVHCRRSFADLAQVAAHATEHFGRGHGADGSA